MLGNPGLIDFYTPFLTAIQDKSGGSLSILARAHLGQTPGLDGHAQSDPSLVCLEAQVESILEVVDTLKQSFKHVVMIAHSMGSWLTLQVSRAHHLSQRFTHILQVLKERPDFVDSVFLLFPTITHIKDTPNGRKLSVGVSSLPKRQVAYVESLPVVVPSPIPNNCFSSLPSRSSVAPLCLEIYVCTLAPRADTGTSEPNTVTFCSVLLLDNGSRRDEKNHGS